VGICGNKQAVVGFEQAQVLVLQIPIGHHVAVKIRVKLVIQLSHRFVAPVPLVANYANDVVRQYHLVHGIEQRKGRYGYQYQYYARQQSPYYLKQCTVHQLVGSGQRKSAAEILVSFEGLVKVADVQLV